LLLSFRIQTSAEAVDNSAKTIYRMVHIIWCDFIHYQSILCQSHPFH